MKTQILLIFRSLSNMISGKDGNISKTCVFIFHYSIRYGEPSGCTLYSEVDCPN